MFVFLRRSLGLGLCVLPALLDTAAATNKSSSNCTNAPDTRSCWLPGYDISTDYTQHLAPPGKLVEVGAVSNMQSRALC